MARLQARAGHPAAEQQAAVRQAMAAGVAYVEASQYGRHALARDPGRLRAGRRRAAVDHPLMFGFENAGWLTATAAAPMPAEVQRFFAGLGLRVLDVYGMTETTGAFTANSPRALQARHGRPGRAGRRDRASPRTARSSPAAPLNTRAT